jgi:tetratricopeptide (TPR) repeat protein
MVTKQVDYNLPFFDVYKEEYQKQVKYKLGKPYAESDLDELHVMIDTFYMHYLNQKDIPVLKTDDSYFVELSSEINKFFSYRKRDTIKPQYISGIYHKTNDSKKKSTTSVEAIRFFIKSYCAYHGINLSNKQPISGDSLKLIHEIETLVNDNRISEAQQKIEVLKTQLPETEDEYPQAWLNFLSAVILDKTDGPIGKQVELLEKCYPVFEKHKLHDQLGTIYFQLAECKKCVGDVAQLRKYGELHVLAMEKVHSKFITGIAHLNIGLKFDAIGIQEDALRCWSRAIVIAKELVSSGDDGNRRLGNEIVFRAYTSKCKILLEQGDFYQARACSVNALKAIKNMVAHPRNEEFGLLCYYIAAIEAYDNNIDSEKFTTSIDTAKTLLKTNEGFFYECLVLEAKAAAAIKDKVKTNEVIKDLVSQARDIAHIEHRCKCLKECAMLCERIENFKFAEELYVEIFELAIKHKLPELELDAFHILNPHTLIQLMSPEYRARLHILLEGLLSNFVEDTSEREKILTLRKVGEIYHRISDFNRAVSLHTRLLKLYDDEDVFDRAAMLLTLSEEHALLGDQKTAIEYGEQCCALLRGSIYYELNTKANIFAGSLHAHYGEKNAAQSYINAAKNLIDNYKVPGLDNGIVFVQNMINNREK